MHLLTKKCLAWGGERGLERVGTHDIEWAPSEPLLPRAYLQEVEL
jgi:hypothetical protein